MDDETKIPITPNSFNHIPLASFLDKTAHPPSLAQSEFETIVRRRKYNLHGLKVFGIPSQHPRLEKTWEFAGWGKVSYKNFSDEEITNADLRMSHQSPTVGQFRGSSLSGCSMTSSLFYAFPAVVAASSIFSPVSLLIACLILFLWKTIFLELASAIHLDGANYTYLLQVSGKTMGLIGAATTLLDSIAVSTVSAASAASYLRGEFSTMPVGEPEIAILFLVGLSLLCCLNVKNSTTVALSFFILHITTMIILIAACIKTWEQHGSSILVSNWELRPRGVAHNTSCIRRHLYWIFGGFETTPTYIDAIRPNAYPAVLRNILISTLILNAPLMLLIHVILPTDSILLQRNMLSVLAEKVAGKWLRTLIVVDCVLVLAAAVVGGICSACALTDTLASDRVFPQLLRKRLPVTGAPYISIICCLTLNILLYASSGFDPATISDVLTVAFLFVLLMFVVSNILLKFNRNRLPRSQRTSILTVLLTLIVTIILLVGNIVRHSGTLELFAIYFLVALAPLIAMQARPRVGRTLMWLYDQLDLHTYRFSMGWNAKIISIIQEARRNPICVWVRREDIHNFVDVVLYIEKYETTARIIFIHAYQHIEAIPKELAQNIKILDEAFPATTMDLMFVGGVFCPALVDAASANLGIPRSQMLMSCPGKGHGWKLADYRGVRVVNF